MTHSNISLTRKSTGNIVNFSILKRHDVDRSIAANHFVHCDLTVAYRGKQCILRIFKTGQARLLAGFGGLKHCQAYELPEYVSQWINDELNIEATPIDCTPLQY